MAAIELLYLVSAADAAGCSRGDDDQPRLASVAVPQGGQLRRVQTGVGGEHAPLIHNVMAADFVIGVSDRASNALNLIVDTGAGRARLAWTGVAQEDVATRGDLGLSSIASALGAIKYVKIRRVWA